MIAQILENHIVSTFPLSEFLLLVIFQFTRLRSIVQVL